MYKYITNTRSFRHADRRNRGRKHENNLIKKKKTANKTRTNENGENLPDCPSWDQSTFELPSVKVEGQIGGGLECGCGTRADRPDFTVQWQFVSVKTNA